jgi:hypothetical protein
MLDRFHEIKPWVIAGAVLGGLFIGVWYPYHHLRSQMQRQIDEARVELGLSLDGSDDWTTLPTHVAMLRERTRGAQKYVPQQDEIAEVLRGLTTSLDAHGVTRPEVTTKKAKHFADYSVIPVSVQFTAQFPETFGVLKRLESLPRLIRIERLELESNARERWAPLTVGLELSTFFSQADDGGDG